MLNEDKQNSTISGENNSLNIGDLREIQENSKTIIKETEGEKSKIQEDQRNPLPQLTGSSQKSQTKNEENKKVINSSIKESQNKTISMENYGAADPIIDILDDDEFLEGDGLIDTNKDGKNSNPPVAKKQLKNLVEKKIVVDETANKIVKNTASTTLPAVITKDPKSVTEVIKTSTATMSHFKTIAAEKKNLRAEFPKNNEVMHHHQRTNSLFTPLIFESKTDEKKSAIAGIAKLMKLPQQQKNPKDIKLFDSTKKIGNSNLGNYNTTVDTNVKNSVRIELSNNKKNMPVKNDKKVEAEISEEIKESKKCEVRKIKTFTQMSQKGWNPQVKKPNQDISFICPNFADQSNFVFFAVCDGHGSYGHDASAFLEKTLPTIFSKELTDKLKGGDKINFNKVFEKSFQMTNVKLKNDLYVDSSLSGSTCVSVLYKGDKLICGNIGDSRAVVGRCVDGKWVNHDLSRDHKPTDKDEADRIKRRGGRVEQAKKINGDYHGPHRLWLPHENIPGIAMSRSFGDEVAASVGVIAEPEVFEWSLSGNDKFFIMASDGIWEFITSQECVDIIKEFYDRNDIEGALPFLIKESSNRWIKEENIIDDTTAILIFFE